MRVGIVGAGNVASHLATRLHALGHEIACVVSRTGDSARVLAEKTGAEVLADVSMIPVDLDMILLCVNDSAVIDVAAELPVSRAIVAHTSGSVPLDVLARHPHSGVFYPLQTFSKDIAIDLSNVPIFVEGSDETTVEALELLARSISESVYRADSEVRARLHVAGVLASNFPIFLLEMAREALSEVGLPLETIHPLVEATIKKAFDTSPLEALTGPARRGDILTVENQSEIFADPLRKAVYDSLSNAILSQFNHKTV